jgi:hypothetical protein
MRLSSERKLYVLWSLWKFYAGDCDENNEKEKTFISTEIQSEYRYIAQQPC